VTPAFLRAKRRHAIVLITVVASLITPGDVITLTALMIVPLVLLYEMSILLSVAIYRRREKSEGDYDDLYDGGLEPPPGAVGTQ
jgi:sec-independent protein translocase protein TatC